MKRAIRFSKNQMALLLLRDYSNSMVEFCFMLYMAVANPLKALYLYRLYIFYHLFNVFVPNLCPTVQCGSCFSFCFSGVYASEHMHDIEPDAIT